MFECMRAPTNCARLFVLDFLISHFGSIILDPHIVLHRNFLSFIFFCLKPRFFSLLSRVNNCMQSLCECVCVCAHRFSDCVIFLRHCVSRAITFVTVAVLVHYTSDHLNMRDSRRQMWHCFHLKNWLEIKWCWLFGFICVPFNLFFSPPLASWCDPWSIYFFLFASNIKWRVLFDEVSTYFWSKNILIEQIHLIVQFIYNLPTY